jgi:periplasmic divalent cation tolerance protein
MTFKDVAEARTIGRALVEEKLAACVNILGNIESIYEWQDELCNETEVAMIAKSTGKQVPALIERVSAMHSYDCPCIVTMVITGGYDPYLDWIGQQTKP